LAVKDFLIIGEIMLTTKTVNEFINELASNSPAPGGGSVASLAGALGSALTSMVCNLTIGKKKYSEVREEMESVLKKSEDLRALLTRLIDEDTDSFNEVMRAFAMPKETDEQKSQRTAAIQRTTKNATLIPLKVMQLCEQTLLLTRVVAEKGNVNSVSDAGVAALMAHAACMSAKLNVQINLGSLHDTAFIQDTTTQIRQIAERVEVMSLSILKHVNDLVNNQS
jgi:methenyltetrahydrofolate cyclohydrolase